MINMIICPTCQHQETPGAVFCSDCGAQLIDESETITKAFTTENIQDASGVQSLEPDASTFSANWLTLHLLENGNILPLSDKTEFSLGRISDGQSIMPDIDLSAYNAYSNGVSRLHAVLKRTGNNVVILDLGSSNGTYLNGKKLTANVATPLNHGDVISLGKLKISILFGKQ